MHIVVEEFIINKENIFEEQLQELKEQADTLAAIYSDNPAYCALLQQKYLSKKAKQVKG